jgi:TRAP-type C4-dicarboxylate transport system permease small subunit
VNDNEKETVNESAPTTGGPPASDVQESPRPHAWGAPFARLDAAWTKLEARLAAGVLIAEILALCAWISLKGLSAEYQVGGEGEKNVSGLVFRGLIGAIVLGMIANRVTRPKPAPGAAGYDRAVLRQNVIVTMSVVVGLALGRVWVNGGVEYFSNFLNWMQSASLLMLIGGLRGVATRLTLWLALLGASLATANGKHINIDVVMRFLTPKMRVPVAILGWVSAAVMCIAGAWGFFDHISIALFHVRPFTECAPGSEGANKAGQCPTPASEKVAHVLHDMGTDWFIIRRQLSLDVGSFPRVVAGTKYNGYLSAAQWNTWVSSGDWSAHFPAEQAAGLLAPTDRPSEPHTPAVSIPGGQEVRGLLIKDADLIFPFGLLMIALRFLLRSLLAISGHVEVDPDSAHKEEDEHKDGLRDDEAAPHTAATTAATLKEES